MYIYTYIFIHLFVHIIMYLFPNRKVPDMLSDSHGDSKSRCSETDTNRNWAIVPRPWGPQSVICTSSV